MASKMLIYLSIDLKIKKRFYKQLRDCPHIYSKLRALVQVLETRLITSELTLDKSTNLIKLSS